MKNKSLLEYIVNPLELLRTQKVLHANPTIEKTRPAVVASEYTVYNYNSQTWNVLRPKAAEGIFTFTQPDRTSWINVDGLVKKDVELICSHFGVHPLIAEDILSLDQRPKMDEINDILFCVIHMLFYNEAGKTIESEQVSIVLGKGFVLSFQEDPTRDVFQPVRNRLQIDNSKVRQNGPDFLFYSLLDLIVDNYFLVMEKLADHIEDLEEEIAHKPDSRTLSYVNALRKELILFKRNISPVRELISGILRSDTDLIEERTEKYFKDVYDHIVQANDLSETYRDMMMNLQDLYLSNVNLKMNEVMKVMAVVTCLLAPATVIGGMFGMNFEHIPLLHNAWGFYISIGLMFVIPAIMIYIFRKRGWF